MKIGISRASSETEGRLFAGRSRDDETKNERKKTTEHPGTPATRWISDEQQCFCFWTKVKRGLCVSPSMKIFILFIDCDVYKQVKNLRDRIGCFAF